MSTRFAGPADPMSRLAALARVERAAGESFGWASAPGRVPASRSWSARAGLLAAAAAATVAAGLAYLV